MGAAKAEKSPVRSAAVGTVENASYGELPRLPFQPTKKMSFRRHCKSSEYSADRRLLARRRQIIPRSRMIHVPSTIGGVQVVSDNQPLRIVFPHDATRPARRYNSQRSSDWRMLAKVA